MRRHLLTITVILAVASGCDNVAFDGARVEIVPPPVTMDTAEVATEEETGPPNVDNPILLAGLRDGPRASLTVVGEIDGDVLRPFPDPAFPSDSARLEELTAPGSRWILFSEGVRVGSLVADEAGPAEGFCGARVTVSGVVEVVPTAAAVERLLALPADAAGNEAYGSYEDMLPLKSSTPLHPTSQT